MQQFKGWQRTLGDVAGAVSEAEAKTQELDKLICAQKAARDTHEKAQRELAALTEKASLLRTVLGQQKTERSLRNSARKKQQHWLQKKLKRTASWRKRAIA